MQFGQIDTGVERDVEEAMSFIKDNMQKSLLYGFEHCYTAERYDEWQSFMQIDKNQVKAVQLLEQYYAEARVLLQQHKDLLDAIADELLKKEILLYDDIVRIAERYQID